MICISIGNIGMIAEANSIQPELIEIRYDLLDVKPTDIAGVLNENIKQIATCRPGKVSEEQRKNLLKSAIDLGAAYVDVELESSDKFIADIVAYAGERDCDIIVSYHNYDFTPGVEELNIILASCYEKGGDIAKLACMVNSEKDIARLLSLYGADGRKVILGMGDLGKITRIVASEIGAEFTFASIDANETTAPGQLTYKEFQSLKKIVNNK
jgi:3-dehydroquinate dehydratase type I